MLLMQLLDLLELLSAKQVQDNNMGITRMDNDGIARKIKRAAAAQTAALCRNINIGEG